MTVAAVLNCMCSSNESHLFKYFS
uniref:Uncharacterized protein n=1 Tax=Arundo donax TaxID=35708 RepID=A0A0A9A572_ARUDO